MPYFTVRGPLAAATFTGPLDIAGGAAGAWGLRALKASMRGSNIVNIVRMNGTTFPTQDFTCDAVTGVLDTAGIATFLGGDEGRLMTFYDQSGGTNHITASSRNNAAVYSASPIAAKWNDDSPNYATGSSVTLNQPFSVSSVWQQGDTSGVQILMQFAASNPRAAYRVGSYFFIDTNSAEVPRNSNVSLDTMFAMQALYNDNAGNKLLLNGNALTLDGDTGSSNAASALQFGAWHSVAATNPSYIREMIVWSSNIGDTARADIESNQRTFWGFS